MPRWSPSAGSTTNPDRNEPTMAPTVFSAYAEPTSRPTEPKSTAATRTESGKMAPIRNVAGSTVTQASTNWQASTASVPKLVVASSQAKK
jgi:hypothetical protein